MSNVNQASQPGSTLPRHKKVAVDIFSGLCAGVNVTFVGHPFETLKVRLQTQPQGADRIYSGLFDCVKKTWAWEGIGGFYKGVSAPLFFQLFFRSITFLSNGEFLRYWSNNGTRQLHIYDYALGGMFSWGCSTLVECPLQLSSSQMQIQIIKMKKDPNYKSPYRNVFDFLYKTTKANGIRGPYQGCFAQLGRNIPGGAFHFGLFEGIRRKYAEVNGIPVEKVGMGVNMVSGAIGGFFFWLLTYPQDVVKSALQADDPDPKKRKYKGIVDAYKQLYAEGGWKRFTRGFSACALRALPANAVLLTTAAKVRELGYNYLENK